LAPDQVAPDGSDLRSSSTVVEDGVSEADNAAPVSLSELTPAPGDLAGHDVSGIELLFDVSLQISVELGRTRMTIGEVLALRSNSVIELDKLAGEPADIYVNGTCIARGEVVVVDEKFGVRVLEVVSRAKRLASV
jgi:flagellar motor switch protein FliN/FliY